MRTERTLAVVAVALLLTLVIPASAQGPGEKAGEILALVGGDVYPVTGEMIPGGTVLIQDGKILRVGKDVSVPAGAKVLDVKGKAVTPGFVALNMSRVGLSSLGGGRGGRGGGPGGSERGAEVADSLDPFDRNIKYCLGVGITAGCVEVGGGRGGRFGRDPEDDTQVCPCCGLTIIDTQPRRSRSGGTASVRRHAVLRMTYGELKPMLVEEAPFYYVSSATLGGKANRFRWREDLRKAKEYVKEQEEHEKKPPAEKGRPPRRPVPEELVKLVKKEVALRTDASTADDIRDMVALAREFDYRLVLDEAHEAWLTADDLGKAGVSVVLTPRSVRRPRPGREEDSGSSIETSGALEKNKVAFALGTLSDSVSLGGLAGRDLTSLPLEAAFAVRGGCSEKTALEALTIVPARLLGLDERIGSIEEGKDADLLVLDGPPLDYRTYVEKAFVGGKEYYDRGKDKIYPVFER